MQQRVEAARAALLGCADVLTNAEIAANRLDDGGERLFVDQRVQPRVTDDEGELGAGQPEVERHEDRAKLRRGEHREKESRVVESQESNSVSGIHSQRMQSMRDLVGEAIELRVGPTLFTEDERSLVRVELRAPAERKAETLIIRHCRKPSDAYRLAAILPFAARERLLCGPAAV